MIDLAWQPDLSGSDLDPDARAALVARFREIQATKTIAPSAAKPPPQWKRVPEPDLSYLDDDPAIAKVRAEVDADGKRFNWRRRHRNMTETNADPEARLTNAQRRALEIAQGIAARGEAVNLASVAAEMGVTEGAVNFHRKALRAAGLWPWDDARRGRPRTTSGPQPTRRAPREAPVEPIVERADDDQVDAGSGPGPDVAGDPFALAGEIAALAIELAAILRSWPIASRRRLCDLALRLLGGSSS